jgi:hypothetical protein
MPSFRAGSQTVHLAMKAHTVAGTTSTHENHRHSRMPAVRSRNRPAPEMAADDSVPAALPERLSPMIG